MIDHKHRYFVSGNRPNAFEKRAKNWNEVGGNGRATPQIRRKLLWRSNRQEHSWRYSVWRYELLQNSNHVGRGSKGDAGWRSLSLHLVWNSGKSSFSFSKRASRVRCVMLCFEYGLVFARLWNVFFNTNLLELVRIEYIYGYSWEIWLQSKLIFDIIIIIKWGLDQCIEWNILSHPF